MVRDLDEVCETSKSFVSESRVSFGRHLLSKKELANAVGVSPRTINNWMAGRRVPYIRISARLIRFDLERVKAALTRYEVKEVGARR